MSAQILRPWAPPAYRPATPAAPLQASQISSADLAFCAEFAVHGGIAESTAGFRSERELLRLQQAGLVDLRRDTAVPFSITQVTLSVGARALLSRPDETAARPAAADPGDERQSRRHGFEVARGMIGAAVKAELASWAASGASGGAAALERRLMARIDGLRVPFAA